MNKAELSQLFKKIKRAYAMFHIPDEIQALRELAGDWLEYLQDTPFETAVENLRRYVLDPANKFPPHPGVLAKSLDAKTDSERYHESMRASGEMTLQEWEEMKKNAVGPTEDQRRRVRESVGRTI